MENQRTGRDISMEYERITKAGETDRFSDGSGFGLTAVRAGIGRPDAARPTVLDFELHC